MKAKILTTVRIEQAWLDEIKEHIPAIEFDIERTIQPLTVYKNTRTNTNYAQWHHFRSLFPTGDYRYRVYVMSDVERLGYGMTDHYAAYNSQDRDGVLDFYMSVGDNSPRAKHNGFRHNFARRFVHETLHGEEQEIGREYLANVNPDRTHQWEAQGRLAELAKEHYTMSLQRTVIQLAQTLLQLLRPSRIMHPTPNFPISQPYGVPNPRYPLTGHHIGTDFATPVATPVRMPVAGTYVQSGYSPVLGTFVVVQYDYKGKRYQSRFAHLDSVSQYDGGEAIPQGSIIGRTGNSGDSTGPHLHVDVWHDRVNLQGITAQNFRDRTIDPEVHYSS